MATLFTRIIDGELPGTFVWKDQHCVAFMTIAPIHRGHVLVVPRSEIDHWIDADPELWRHLNDVAHIVGNALAAAFSPRRVGTMVAGFEVPHLHIHVIPMDSMADIDFANADDSVPAAALTEDANAIVAALRGAGHEPGV